MQSRRKGLGTIAKVYNNFRDLHYLQQYERASVIGIVCSVSKFLVKK